MNRQCSFVFFALSLCVLRADDSAPSSANLSVSASVQSASTVPSVSGKTLEVVDGGYVKLGFNVLASYKYVAPAFDPVATPNATPPSGEEQIPNDIKKLDGKKAMVAGFMLPVKMENGLVKEFLLVKDQMMCCYGAIPQMNEWIVVKMPKEGVKPVMDVPVSFYGQIHVKEMYENGYMTGLYLLDGEKMGQPQS